MPSSRWWAAAVADRNRERLLESDLLGTAMTGDFRIGYVHE